MEFEGDLTSFDGTKLFFRKDIPVSPKAVFVLAHGMCEHSGRYGYLTARLNAAGYAVYRFDHRGHGKSEGKRVFYGKFDEIVGDTDAALNAARTDYPTLPVFLLGHSMGGYAASLYGIMYPGKVNGIILSGAITTNNSAIGEAACAGKPAVEEYFPASSNGVSSDPKMVKAWEDDPLVDKQISAGLLYTLLDGVEYIKVNAAQFTDPALFIHGAADSIVSEKDSRDLFGMIASADKELKIYAKLYHELFNEPSRDEVIADVLRWMDKRVSV